MGELCEHKKRDFFVRIFGFTLKTIISDSKRVSERTTRERQRSKMRGGGSEEAYQATETDPTKGGPRSHSIISRCPFVGILRAMRESYHMPACLH